MKLALVKGTTSYRARVFIQDSASTTGAGKTGLVYNTSGLSAYYHRQGGSATSITLATQTVTGAYASGGFVEIDATNMPGWYRFDIPNACLASGSDDVGIVLRGASGMADLTMEIQLTGADLNNATDLGLSRLDAAISTVPSSVRDIFALSTSVDDSTPANNNFNGPSGLSSTDDFYNGCVWQFTSGALDGIARKITNYIGATRTFEFSGAAGSADAAFPTAPANGDTGIILGRIG